MTREGMGILVMIAAVAVESFAQLFLKLGAAPRRQGDPVQPAGAGQSGWWWVPLGVAAYLVEIALYTAALHFLDVSVAFPLGSLCFVGVALLSRWLLSETVGRLRWIGIGCILAGAVLVTR